MDMFQKQMFCFVCACMVAFTRAKETEPPEVDLSDAELCLTDSDCLENEICSHQGEEKRCELRMGSSAMDLTNLGVQVLTGGGLNVSSLSLLGRDSKIILGATGMVYALTCDKQGNFAITYDDESQFYVEKNGNIHVDGKLFCEGGVQLNGQLQLMGEWGASPPQFFLGSIEMFTADYCSKGQANGKWTNCSTTPCGGKYLLGGYGAFSNGETSKTYRGLALHSQVRLIFTFMFLDGWEGETAFAKVDGHYVWSESYDHKTGKSGVNVCGAPAAESKFGVPVDIIVPHNQSSITITFGSNLEFSPFEVSWGLSDVELLYA